MKKLLSVFCCVIYLQSLSQPASLDIKVAPQTGSPGKKILIKALAVIVNREGNKKTPLKKVTPPSTESPWL